MEETGIVIGQEGDEAVVQFTRTEACKKCGACKYTKDGELTLRVENTVRARPGDSITVELAETAVFTASLLAYGLPIAGLVGGLLLGSALEPLFPAVPANVLPAIGALGLAAAAFFLNRLFEPRRRRSGKYQPRAISARPKGEENNGK